jgi:CRP-like cAMP-binding protein
MNSERNEPRHVAEREIFLRSMALGRAPTGDNRRLGEAMTEAFFAAGSVLYEAGDPSDEVFFIVSGEVELRKEGSAPRRFDATSVIGVLDASREAPYERTAVALTDVEALVLRNEDRIDLFEDSFEYTREVILFTAAALHELTLQLPSLGVVSSDAAGEEAGPVASPLPLVERVLTLRDVQAFANASIQTLLSLAPAALEVRIAQGETLFRAGEVRAVFYVVVSGCIELRREHPPGVARFGPATLVGGVPAIGDAERLYSAHALRDSVLLCFREVDFFDVMEDHFELARCVLAFIASERVRVVDELEARAPAAVDRS